MDLLPHRRPLSTAARVAAIRPRVAKVHRPKGEVVLKLKSGVPSRPSEVEERRACLSPVAQTVLSGPCL